MLTDTSNLLYADWQLLLLAMERDHERERRMDRDKQRGVYRNNWEDRRQENRYEGVGMEDERGRKNDRDTGIDRNRQAGRQTEEQMK